MSALQCLAEALPKLNYNRSMKFERQRSPQAAGNKYELTNQEFLTFRNNPVTENSGRTVYSQQLDYRSLDRYEKPEEQTDTHFNFHKNIKNMRSIDKYKQLREEALLFQTTEENNESQLGSIERREELKSKLAKLKKSLKREQKKQLALNEQISKAEFSIQQINEANCKLQNDIKQLSQILKDNDRNIHLLTRRLDEYKASERTLISRKSYCDSTIQGELKSGRVQEHSTLEYQKKLLLGIEGLEDYIQELQEETSYFQEEIERLQANLSALSTVDSQLREALSK